MEFKLYKCAHCGQIVMKVLPTKVPVICCGEPMQELKSRSVDAAVEKHVPVVKQSGCAVEVTVGEVDHPMEEDHYITHIFAVTTTGVQIVELKQGDKPKATFGLAEGQKLVAVYEYCNLHGL